jgi:5-carboxymethyl-2-hydroxymuconate isomerase
MGGSSVPHITVEYSANLEDRISPQRLVETIHHAALATGLFEIGAVRTRAARRDVYCVADEDPANGFIAVIARIGQGRDMEARGQLANAILSVLKAETEEISKTRGLGLTVEVQEIQPPSLKLNNLHERIRTAKAKEKIAAR